MLSRKMILAVLVGGPVLGTLLGLATNTTILPPPEPAWRSAEPDPIFVEAQSRDDTGPQQVAANWSVNALADRIPTWKRRSEMQQAAYVPEIADTPPVEQEMAAEPVSAAPLDEAAAPPNARAAAPAASAALSDEAPAAADEAPAIVLDAAQAGA